ncbi:MAG: NTP transferase domain-containing protein [Epsilonproteobacteria bacterium]|nr:NTP transferase domain-containing protein [Campylobacterota bacterium]
MAKRLEEINRKYKNIISINSKIIDPLKVMNDTNINLLIVMDAKKFIGLLSIGDIRRAILDNHDINKLNINQIMRKDVLVAHTEESIERVKQIMLDKQIVCMPVVDENNMLTNIYYWDELFGDKQELESLDVDVVIMAGGKGSRLKPITNIIPKPLVPVGEKPIIEIIIDNFMQHQVKNFYISVNYKAKMIEDYLQPKESEACQLSYFTEDKPLGTIGSLHLIRDLLNKTIFVSNCDIIIDDDYADIYNYHKENNNDITIVSAVKHVSIPYGVMETEKGGNLIGMTEKPEFTFQVNTGMYILEPHVIKRIPENEFYHITDLIEEINDSGKVGVFPVAEKSWHDIGQWKEYQDTLINYK